MKRNIFQRKKGFTLIEIIICLVLISLITTVSVVSINRYSNNKVNNILEKNANKIENALQVYLSTNPEVIDNVNKNAKGAIVTLSVLKKAGLISDFISLSEQELKSNYYLLSNAVLAPTGADTSCESAQVSLATIASWNVDTSNVMYVCPISSTKESNNTQVGADELEKRVKALEKQLENTVNFYTGADAKNYVYYNVSNSLNANETAKWPDSDTNLWRIYSYYGTDGSVNNIKLVYNKSIELNNDYIFVEKKDIYSSSNDYYENDSNHQIISASKVVETSCTADGHTIYILNDNDYYKYMGCYGRCKHKDYLLEKYEGTVDSDYLPNTFRCTSAYTNTFLTINKNDLFDKIIHKDWVEKYPYYYDYNGTNRIDAKINKANVLYNKIGVLNMNEFNDTIKNGDTWLRYYTNNNIGILNYSFETYYVFPEVSGKINTINDNSIDSYTNLIFVPVVTLISGVKIIDNPNCANSGSKECPYLLEYDGIQTSQNN